MKPFLKNRAWTSTLPSPYMFVPAKKMSGGKHTKLIIVVTSGRGTGGRGWRIFIFGGVTFKRC